MDILHKIRQKNNIITNKFDKNTYRSKVLSNGIEVVTITNQLTAYSTCSLSIKVGSYNDTIPGIAHLLEHIICYGSNKFDIKWPVFIAKSNGYDNAITETDTTTYFFQVVYENFIEALERFSESLRSPDFSLELLKSAVSAVDSEFKSYILNQEYRISQVINIHSNEPFNNFWSGNKESLLMEESEATSLNEDDEVYLKLQKKLQEFWGSFYDPKLMKIVIYHDENILNKLEDIFGSSKFIGNTSLSYFLQNQYSDRNFIPKLYNIEFTNKFVFVEPINDRNEIIINIEIPHEKLAYKNNTINYLKFILESEYEGSLLHKLKEKKYSYRVQICIIKNLYWKILRIEIKLTDIGYNNKFLVINLFYTHLYDLVYSAKEYQLLKYKYHKDFKNRETGNIINYTNSISSNMHYLPIKNIINHDFIYKAFDNQEITELLNIIKSYENWLILLVSKKYFDKDTQYKTEKYYKTKYFVSNESIIKDKYRGSEKVQNTVSSRVKLLHEMMQSLLHKPTSYYFSTNKNLSLVPFLKDLFYNRPITSIFKLKDKYDRVNTIRKKSETGIFRYIYNPEYNSPKSYVTIKLNTEINRSNYVKNMLYITLMSHIYDEKYHDLEFLLSNNITYKVLKDGIEFDFVGYNNTITTSINRYFNMFFNIQIKDISLAKLILIDSFQKEKNKTPKENIFDIFENEIYGLKPSIDDCISEIQNLRVEDIIINRNYFVEMFICSNIQHKPFLDSYNILCSKILPARKFIHNQQLVKDLLECTTNDKINNAVGIFFQYGKISDLKSLASGQMIIPTFHQMIYDRLRTKEKLCYLVEFSDKWYNKNFYSYFFIQSEKSCEILVERLQNFIKEVNDQIDKMTKSKFNNIKYTYSAYFKGKERTLDAYFKFYKSLYNNDALDLKYKRKMVGILRSIRQEDLKFSDNMVIVKAHKKNQ